MLSLKTKELSSARDVIRSVCRQIRLSFSKTWLIQIVLENSNVAHLASSEYLSVHSQPKEDRYDTDDASPREIYSILVPEPTLGAVQSPRRRQHRASVVDRDTPAHRTAALYSMRPGVLGTGGHPHGPPQAPRRDGHTAGAMSALGRL